MVPGLCIRTQQTHRRLNLRLETKLYQLEKTRPKMEVFSGRNQYIRDGAETAHDNYWRESETGCPQLQENYRA